MCSDVGAEIIGRNPPPDLFTTPFEQGDNHLDLSAVERTKIQNLCADAYHPVYRFFSV